MGKFNINAKQTTYEGGSAFQKDIESQWINMLFSWFVESGYYESDNEMQLRFHALTKKVIELRGAQCVVKLACFSRNEMGMRSASCIVAACLNDANFEGKREFFRNFFHRADDVAEVLSIIKKMQSKPSHAFIRGTCGYVNLLNEYSVSKYRMEGKPYSMMDIVNLTHAKSNAIAKLKNDTLPIAVTWENEVFKATTFEEKSEVWQKLVENGNLGVMALTRNLRNIITYCSDMSYDVFERNVLNRFYDENAIRKSLMFPYRFYSAYKSLQDYGRYDYFLNADQKDMLGHLYKALQHAFVASFVNVPKIEGPTAILLDASGSMFCPMSSKSRRTFAEIGALYATMFKVMCPDSDAFAFATYATKIDSTFNENNPFDLARRLHNLDVGYGTNISPAIELMDKHYDRIVIISDMQVANRVRPEDKTTLSTYMNTYGQSKVYSFDMGQYVHQGVFEGDIIQITGLNDNVFKFMQLAEQDKSLIDYVASL